MAETNKNQSPETGAENVDVTQVEPKAKEEQGTENSEPDVKELMAKIAQLEADKAKQKNALDKALKENGDVKKQLRAKLTADEREEEARREAQEEHDKYVKSLEREVNLGKATSRYLALGMSAELAAQTAEAELDNDMDAVAANYNKFNEEAIKAAKAEWLKSRPPANAGGGEKTITQEQFDAMSIAELTKFKKENPNEYKRLMGKE